MEQTGPNLKGIATRSEGRENYPLAPPVVPFPESQQFAGNMATSLATGTGTTSWKTLELDSLPMNAEYANIAFNAYEVTTFGTANAVLQVRRDDQPDSAVIDVARMRCGNGDTLSQNFTFVAPLTMGGRRSFQYQITGTLAAAWSLTLVSYHTRKRNVASANETIPNTGGGEGSGSDGGGPTPDPR